MNKISNFLAGIKVLEEVDSPINGKLTVIKSIAFGTYIQAGGLTQSGGIVKWIWDKTLKKVKNEATASQTTLKVQNCLILGLGGGSLVELTYKYWPDAKITAVDVDESIVELGKKYLGLEAQKTEIIIADAFDSLNKQNSKDKRLNSRYDLILIDLYNGDKYPDKFETENYLELVKSHLTNEGVAVFNRLYYDEKRPQAVKFLKKLEKIFSNVDVYYPEANVMFVCKK